MRSDRYQEKEQLREIRNSTKFTAVTFISKITQTACLSQSLGVFDPIYKKKVLIETLTGL